MPEQQVELTLYADNSLASYRAQTLLQEAGLDFSIIPTSGDNLPGIQISNGRIWWGIRDVERIIRHHQEEKESALSGAPRPERGKDEIP